MAGLHAKYDATTVVPVNYGTVLVGKKLTAAIPDVSKINLKDADTFGTDWTPVGLTSKETLPALSVEGGETKTLDTWELSSVDVSTTAQVLSFSFSVVGLTKEALQAAYGGNISDTVNNTYDVAKKLQWISSEIVTVEAPVIILAGGSGKQFAYFIPRAKLSADGFGEISDGQLYSIKMKGTALAPSPEQSKAGYNHPIGFIHPEAKGQAAAPGGAPAGPGAGPVP